MTINQTHNQKYDDQIFYDNRWVSKENFRVFVYNGQDKKLANSYDEYKSLIDSGLWFASLDAVEPTHPISIRRGRKPKHGTDG